MHKHKMTVNEKPKDFKKNLKKLLKYISPYKTYIGISFVLAIVSSSTSVLIPNIIGEITDKIITGITYEHSAFQTIVKLIIETLCILVISSIAGILEGFIMSKVSYKIGYNLRKQINNKINKLPLSYFDRNTNGEILSFITNDVDTLTNNLSQSLTSIVSSIILLFGTLYMMFRISLLLTLVMLLSIPVCFLILIVFIMKGQKYFDQRQKYLGHINGHIEETYAGHTTIKLYNLENKKIKKLDNLNETLYESSWKSQFYSSIIQPLLRFLGNLGYVVGCGLGGYLIVKGKGLTIGKVQAFVQYAKTFNRPLADLSALTGTFQQIISASERIFNYLEEENEKDLIINKIDSNNLKGHIEFKNVNFGYGDKTIIHDFNIDVSPGKRIAIVGPTGAGKTTIVKLLMNYYDLKKGKILIDGIDINELSKNNLREQIGMVLQDTWLFESTIQDNIMYGKQNCSLEEIKNAAKLACVDHFINTLPNGYNFTLNEEGNNISEGEKQLIAIARTILKDPKILILDEATSNVDTRTEVLIQKAMNNLMKDKTCFIIAHRLSTIKNADLILVMNHGNIVEKGTHKELLKLNGFYKKLYYSQFETQKND